MKPGKLLTQLLPVTVIIILSQSLEIKTDAIIVKEPQVIANKFNSLFSNIVKILHKKSQM